MMRTGKAECKAELQKELGLPQDPKTLLVGWIGRLDHQKGPDVVLDALPGLMQRGCQVGPDFVQASQGLLSTRSGHAREGAVWTRMTASACFQFAQGLGPCTRLSLFLSWPHSPSTAVDGLH